MNIGVNIVGYKNINVYVNNYDYIYVYVFVEIYKVENYFIKVFLVSPGDTKLIIK